jgi:hypothetical protein
VLPKLGENLEHHTDDESHWPARTYAFDGKGLDPCSDEIYAGTDQGKPEEYQICTDLADGKGTLKGIFFRWGTI